MRTVLYVLVIFVAAFANAQQPSDPTPAPHNLLAKQVGTWDCDVKMFFPSPGSRPSEFKGVEVNELVSGDLYLRTSFKYQMGERGAFEGHSLQGYDPRSKRYVGTWVVNMTSVPSQINGEYNEKAKTLTVHSTVVDSSGKELKTKKINTWLDESRKKLEIFLVVKVSGKETEIKLMEMTANNRK